MAKDVVARDFTINLHKRLHSIGAKKRAPRAIKAIRAFASLNMSVPQKEIRLDATINKALWANGINHVPMRLRVRISRLRQTGEGKEKKFYAVVSHVAVPRNQIAHMKTETVESEAQ